MSDKICLEQLEIELIKFCSQL